MAAMRYICFRLEGQPAFFLCVCVCVQIGGRLPLFQECLLRRLGLTVRISCSDMSCRGSADGQLLAWREGMHAFAIPTFPKGRCYDDVETLNHRLTAALMAS